MDATQILEDLDEEDINHSGTKKTVAFLKVFAVGSFPETLFPVYEGENVVGRHNCDITLPLQAVSKKHACIDVHGKNHLICDYNSRNKTRRNQMFLKPQAFYELVNEVELMFADVKCQYLLAQTEDVVEKEIADSGSETASESMMPESIEDEDEELKEEPRKESLEKYLDQPTLEYDYENPGEHSTLFCAETDDDETDDDKTDDESETNDNSNNTSCNTKPLFSKEKTVEYSAEATANDSTLETTMPYNTIPNTQEPDVIPETPFPQTNSTESPFKLKRSVDVKVDTSRRVSAGNTLAYGLSTLESPADTTRESIDVSQNDSAKSETSGECEKVRNKLLFDNTPDKESPRPSCPLPKQDEAFDDLLATQLYEPMEIPESPEYLESDKNDEKLTTENTPKTTARETPEDTIPNCKNQGPENKFSEDKISEGGNPENKVSDDKKSYGRDSGNVTSEDTIPNCSTLEETQAYVLPQDEYDDMPTQAYGLLDTDTAGTEDEMAETQAYGVESDLEIPKLAAPTKSVFKVPGAMNTQDLHKDICDGGGAKEEYNDEMDFQPTQKYVEETSESSDPDNSLNVSRFLGLLSESDSDFMSTKEVVKPETSTPAVRKSSVVIEGGKTLSTGKRCRVELPEDEISDVKLQTSLLDPSAENDDFVPKCKIMREGKGVARRSRKGRKGELESNDGSEGKSDSKKEDAKPVRKGRSRKKQELDIEEDERDETIDDEKHTVSEKEDTGVKHTKKGRGKEIKDIEKDERKVSNKDTPGQHASEERTSLGQDLTDTGTPEASESKTSGKKGRQATAKTSRRKVGSKFEDVQGVDVNEDIVVDEPKKIQPRTPARKRKSSENEQQKKGTAKKSRRNTRTEVISPENDGMKFDTEDILPPTSSLVKRSSSTASTSSNASSKVSRSGRKGKKQMKENSEDSADVKIVFTGLQDSAFNKANKIVQALGGKVVEHLEDCTHLVTDKVRRTVKLLCAISRGIPVVDMCWLEASKKRKSFADSESYILKDDDAQQKFSFSMERSLKLARDDSLLDGYKIHVTPNVRPSPPEMKEIIKSAKGEVLTRMPTTRDAKNDNVIVLSCEEDKNLCIKAKIRKAYTAELLLTGILKQQLDLEPYELPLNTETKPSKRRQKSLK
ncbi:mediator of DNA damage checkpoint protein 1-like isoform X2 [Dendronephthya gigantea]|uniref:mediator of DNA damage checkpoint protein 1-like isoform X2 n=1 Tax=Dendronephthya gigantea TaxID=151771 RepID=UPI00106C73F7|nr:mediator of DNA damage checkpoint protein 1-like isoform X2 [Dendronephthya gigantea]